MTAEAGSPNIDGEAARLTARWFNLLYTGLTGWHTIFAVDRTTGEQHIRWAQTIEQLTHHAQALADRCCVWHGVATRTHRTRGRGGADDCHQIPALWVDIDIAGPNHTANNLPPTLQDAHTLLNDFQLPPTAIINTGGGLQAWWILAEPLDATDAQPLLTRWGTTWAELGHRRGWHVDNVFDLARILRVPGTWNRKNPPPQPVTIEQLEPNRLWGIDDLDQWTLDAPTPPEPVRKDRVPYIGPERPGDAFNIAHDGNDVLTTHGWTFNHVDHEGNRHYRAPHHRGDSSTGATVYNSDGHTTIWSDTIAQQTGAVVRRPYDPFGLYAALSHHGNFQDAYATLKTQGYGTTHRIGIDVDALLAAAHHQDPDSPPQPGLARWLINWPAFWTQDHGDTEWLLEPILAKGRGHALYATAKSGKSLLLLEAAAALATGRAFLGQPAGPPRPALYIDYEMSEVDLIERLETMGYGPETDLSLLRYILLPSIPGLDTPEGAKYIIEATIAWGIELVLIDTTARAVEGEENSADTFRAFYRHLGLALKSRGVTYVRVDHAGKDADKGQRGSSAKNDDVDVVWWYLRKEGGAQLTTRYRRMAWVPEHVDLHIINDPVLSHRLAAAPSVPAGTKECMEDLDRLGVPVDTSFRKAAKGLRDAGLKASNVVLAASIKARKTARNTARNTSVEAIFGTPADPSRNDSEHAGQTVRNAERNSSEQDPSLRTERSAPLRGAERSTGHPPNPLLD